MESTVTNASDVQFGLLVVIFGIVAIGACWGANSALIRKRVLQDTPTALIRSASQGYIELQGHAELIDGEPIYSPLSLTPCVWYRYKVEKKQRSSGMNQNSNAWVTIDNGLSDSLFYIVDSTGRCVVDPEGASVSASAKNVWYGRDRTPGRVKMSSNWFRFTGLAQVGQSYRYTEHRIVAGDPLYALGDFTTHGGVNPNIDKPAEITALLREWKKNSSELLDRFDENNDGEIDLEEWEQARKAAAKAVDESSKQAAAAPPVDVLGHAKGSRNPFVLAAKTEQEMLSRFHFHAVGLFSLALTSSVLVLWMISIR